MRRCISHVGKHFENQTNCNVHDGALRQVLRVSVTSLRDVTR